MLIDQVVKQMRHLTDNGIPFSFEFVSFNQSKKISKGIVKVDNAILRPSRLTKSITLVAYTRLTDDTPKFFHLPLVTKFNGKLISQ